MKTCIVILTIWGMAAIADYGYFCLRESERYDGKHMDVPLAFLGVPVLAWLTVRVLVWSGI